MVLRMNHNKYNMLHYFPMYHFSTDDIEEFANWLGFEGSDADTFYEAYYEIDHYDDIEAYDIEAAYDP